MLQNPVFSRGLSCPCFQNTIICILFKQKYSLVGESSVHRRDQIKQKRPQNTGFWKLHYWNARKNQWFCIGTMSKPRFLQYFLVPQLMWPLIQQKELRSQEQFFVVGLSRWASPSQGQKVALSHFHLINKSVWFEA
jgi:hypothetical protein